MNAIAILIVLFILTALSFFISASETSIVALNKIRLRHLLAQGVKRAKNLQGLITKLDRFITAVLIGNNFVNIAMSAIITAIFVHLFGYEWGVVIATFASSFLIVIVCEITPKLLAIKHTEKIALFVAPLWGFLIDFFHFSIDFFTGISNFILRMLRVGPSKRSPLITEEELRLMIEIGKEEGVLSDEEMKMLHRIFEFGNTKVRDVMISKDKIVAVNSNISSEDLLNIFIEEGHARLPVYEGSIENIIGIVYAHDLLYILRDKGLFLLQDLLHAPYYVPASARVNELLKTFQTNKIQIAIVVDDKKNALGLLTLEDLIEEIVGEIEEKKNPPHHWAKHKK